MVVARDSPRDMFTASGGAERTDTQSYSWAHHLSGKAGLEAEERALLCRRVEGPNFWLESLTVQQDGLT